LSVTRRHGRAVKAAALWPLPTVQEWGVQPSIFPPAKCGAGVAEIGAAWLRSERKPTALFRRGRAHTTAICSIAGTCWRSKLPVKVLGKATGTATQAYGKLEPLTSSTTSPQIRGM